MEFEELRNILVKILGVAPDEITMDTSFEEDLGADSLDMYQVVVQMEETFKVKVTPQEIEKIKRVSEAVAYIKATEKRKPTDSEI